MMTRLLKFVASLYPASFRERVGESMQQTLADSYSRLGPAGKLSIIGDLVFGAACENIVSIEEKVTSRAIVAPLVAATTGMLLIVPGVTMFTLLLLGLEPPLGALGSFLKAPPDVPNIAGSLVALTIIVFLPLAGLILNYAAMRRSTLIEGSRFAYRTNLLVAALGLCLVLSFIAGVVIDQYPCWMGVPNCD